VNEETVTTIDLVRHGETGDGNFRFRGRTDEPLSDLGWSQLRSVVPEQPQWESIVSSPLRRCSEFANELNRRFGLAVDLQSNLAEMDFGDWEGMTVEQVQAENSVALGQFWTDPESAAAPSGETLIDFYGRIDSGWQTLLQRSAGRHVLLVSHGGVMRVILARVLGIPRTNLWNLDVPNAGCSRVRYYGNRPVLVFLNRTEFHP